MEAVLYRNSNGQPVTHSSYSSRQTFKHCPREFELTRVQGWWEKGVRAAPQFGKCVEAGVQAYEESGRQAGKSVTEFERLWRAAKTTAEFPQWQYTDSEGDWDSLLRAGQEMMRLYEIRAPYLPISTNPKTLFQQVLRKRIFPGTELDVLENKAIVDALSFPAWNHKMLPPVAADEFGLIETAEHGKCRSLIVDIKTSGMDLELELIPLDPQLGEYAWQARIPDVAFLWFVKKSHGLKKGSRVTLLESAGVWNAGFELLVLDTEKDDQCAWLGDRAALDGFEAAVKGTRGKARDAAAAAYFAAGMDSGAVVSCAASAFTKQRLQFGAARLSVAQMDEIGRDVAQSTVEMVRAHNEAYYPKQAGIRFPNQKCNFCAMRWICLGKSDQRDANLSRRGEEWLDANGEE